MAYKSLMPTRKSRNDVSSLVLGIVSIGLSFLVALIGTICAIVGIVYGAKTFRTSKIGKAGLICSIIGLGLNVTIWIMGAIQASIAMQQGVTFF